MHVGVIRGDLSGPIFLADLEPVSKHDPAIEPSGQERYVSRPTVAEIEAVLASSTSGAGANERGLDISATFPITINAGNQALKIKTSAAAAFITVNVATGVYADLASFVAAVNAALSNTGVFAYGSTVVAAEHLHLESATYGVSSYLEIDSVAGGSTFNTPGGLPAGGVVRTMPAATDYITACLPVGGPLDVSTPTVGVVGAGTALAALRYVPASRGTVAAMADAIAPQFVDTDVATKSFQVGMIAEARSVNYNPDPRRFPPLANGPAVEVVQDDGVTPFAAALPTITNAQVNVPGPGDVTITGFGLGDEEVYETQVKFTGTGAKVLPHEIITNAGGTIAPTSIVIPAALIPGVVATTTSVQVRFTSLASNTFVLV